MGKTGRLLVVHEAAVRCGIGGDIIRQVLEKYTERGKIAPKLKVLGGANLPIPFTRVLETACIPQEKDIIAAAEAMM